MSLRAALVLPEEAGAVEEEEEERESVGAAEDSEDAEADLDAEREEREELRRQRGFERSGDVDSRVRGGG
jgi:hypothetical protein